ncbi:MAG: hypothetical protein ACO1SV_22440 [Fimbriimonas sp.]
MPPVAGIGRTATLQSDFDAQRKRGTVIGLIIAALVLLGGLIFGIKAFGGLSAQGGTPDQSLNARGKTPNRVLQANADQSPPVLNKSGERPTPLTMPPDVLDWLKHLERCEAMKIEISGDQEGEMQLFLTKLSVLGADIGLQDPFDQSQDHEGDTSPDQYSKGKVLDLRPRWEELITFFNSKRPPAECKPLADDFNQALSEIPGMAGDVADILNGVATNPQDALEKARKMQNKSFSAIDRPLMMADQKLGQICAKYNTNKWFNIKSGSGSGNILGRIGGLGGAGGTPLPGGTTAGF